MFIAPERPRAGQPRPGAARRQAWRHPGWAALRARRPGTGAGLLLCAALTVLLDRYGLPVRLVAGPGCGSPDAARRYLAEHPQDACWAGLLAAARDGSADGSGAADAAVGGVPGQGPTPEVTISVDAGPPSGPADLSLASAGDEVHCAWNPAAFPDETVTAIAGHFGRLCDQLVRPDQPPLAGIETLTPAELAVNGGTPAELPDYPPVTLHQLFQLQAWRTPDAPALAMSGADPADPPGGGATLSYRELDEASNMVAHRLLAIGIQPGDVVAVGGERCIGLFTALLGILKAGGVFVYLDPAQPGSRLGQYVEVCRPQVILQGPGATDLRPGPPQLDLSAVGDLAGPGPRTAPDVLVGSEDPAYILFTSGSTGSPKGVLRPHRLHTARVFLEQSLYQLGPSDRHLLKLPVSSRELFWPLATGGTAVIAEPGSERDDHYLASLLRREQISVISCVPSMLRVMATSPDFTRLPALRHVFVGGETLHRDLEERVRGLGYEVHNTYTLTEADYVAHRRDAPAERTDASVIGTPLDMRVYLCDEAGRRVPPGLTGEMWVGGPGLAAGYYREPGLTASRFVANPFGDPRAPVLFRTGDLARHRPDGTLEYRGRRDLQVKVRGHRVEPTEVEYWIREYPGASDAAVVGYADAEQGAFLVAFVVPADDARPGSAGPEQDLRAFLSARLPGAMVPRHIILVARLPKLRSGKVDRAALRLPDRVRPGDLSPPAPPATAVQRRLHRLWCTVLQLPEVGVADQFTALGGDSLRLMLLRAAIADEFGRSVDLADLMAAQTIETQAALLAGPTAAQAPAAGAETPTAPHDAAPAGDVAVLGGTRAGAVAHERARRAALRAAQAAASAAQEVSAQ